MVDQQAKTSLSLKPTSFKIPFSNIKPSSVGAKLRYMGYFPSLLHPPGRKSWLLFSVRDMSGDLRNPCFIKFSVVRFL